MILINKLGDTSEPSFLIVIKSDGKVRLKNMSARKTYAEVKNAIEVEFSTWMKLLLASEDYKSNKDKLTVKDDLGYFYSLSYDKLSHAFKRNCKLEKFHTSNNFTINNICNYLILNNSKWNILSTVYIGNDKELFVQCENNHTFNRTLLQIQENCTNCAICKGKIRHNTESYKKEVELITNNEYSAIGEFINVDAHTLMKHNICGHEWNASPYSFVKLSTRCPRCVGKHRRTTEEANTLLKELTNGDYEIIGKFKNVNYKIETIHISCGHVWHPTFNNLIHKINPTRCPRCKPKSKGELAIKKFLLEHNIDFILEYRFEDCRNKKPLPFDFYLPTYHKIIEFDGRQHYKISQFGGISTERALEEFKNLQINDEIKNTYCKNNNIPLTRIPYWEIKNIPNILNNIIKKGGENIQYE